MVNWPGRQGNGICGVLKRSAREKGFPLGPRRGAGMASRFAEPQGAGFSRARAWAAGPSPPFAESLWSGPSKGPPGRCFCKAAAIPAPGPSSHPTTTKMRESEPMIRKKSRKRWLCKKLSRHRRTRRAKLRGEVPEGPHPSGRNDEVEAQRRRWTLRSASTKQILTGG